jgi:alanine racemase
LVGEKTKIIAATKGNAYGHGVVAVARALTSCGAHALMMGRIDEAVAVRSAGISIPIIVFGSVLPKDLPTLLDYKLTPTVHNMETAAYLGKLAADNISVYLKVDSGLGRLGIRIDETVKFCRAISKFKNLQLEGIYTHLPFADRHGREWAGERVQQFDELVAILEKEGIRIPVRQVRSSSHVLTGLKDKNCNAVCVGHILYGLSAVDVSVSDIGAFKPVFRSLKAQLIHVGYHRAGSRMWLGGQYSAKQAKMTGVVPIGLCDGLPSLPSGPCVQPHVLVNGSQAPILGISLEHTVVDLSGLKTCRVGDEVVFFEEESKLPLNRFASAFSRTPIEMLMFLSGRLNYIYRSSDKEPAASRSTARGTL